VRQLDRVLGEALRRAWSAGAGPGSERLVIDLDSFVCEVHGAKKQGAAYGYSHKLGYHPIIATRSDTLETLHWSSPARVDRVGLGGLFLFFHEIELDLLVLGGGALPEGAVAALAVVEDLDVVEDFAAELVLGRP
jgi:hypothetical protein